MSTTTEAQLLNKLAACFPLNGGLADPVTGPYKSMQYNTAGAPAQPIFGKRWGNNTGLSIDAVSQAYTFTTPAMYFPVYSGRPVSISVSFWFLLSATDDANNGALYACPNFRIYAAFNNGMPQLSLAWNFSANYSLSFPLASKSAALQPDTWYNLCLNYACSADSTSQKVSVWINGRQFSDIDLPTTQPPLAPFEQAVTFRYPRGKFCLYNIFNAGLTPGEMAYIASDLFNPANDPSGSTLDFCAVSLDGPGGISCVDNGRLNPAHAGNGLTIAAWFRTNSLDVSNGREALICNRRPFSFGVDNEGMLFARFALANTLQLLIVSPVGVAAYGEWVYAAVAFNAEKAELFINGESVAQVAVPDQYVDEHYTSFSLAVDWSTSLYSVEVYGMAMNAQQVTQAMNATIQQSEPNSLANLIVCHDLSTRPAVAISPYPDLQVPAYLPGNAIYHQYSRSAVFCMNSYADCGSEAAAGLLIDLPPGGGGIGTAKVDLLTFTLTAWVFPVTLGEHNTIAACHDGTQGYLFSLENGYLVFSIIPSSGRPIIRKSPIGLPANRWSQVGATVTLTDYNNEQLDTYSLYSSVFVNGYIQDQYLQLLLKPPAPVKPDPSTHFTIGARVYQAEKKGIVSRIVDQGFEGFIQRVSLYHVETDPYSLYFREDENPTPPDFDWNFDLDMPIDLVSNELVALAGGTYLDATDERVSGAPLINALVPGQLSRSRREERLASFQNDLYPQLSGQLQKLMITGPENLNKIVVHDIDGRRYLVGYAEQLGQPGYVAMITDISDPMPLWIQFSIDVFSLGLSVWGVYVGSAAKAVAAMTRIWQITAVRVAIFTFVEESTTSRDAAANFLNAGRTFYREGVLGTLLSAFSISWFTILRLLGLFVPWLGAASIIAQLALVGLELLELIRRKPEKKGTGVLAWANKAPDLLNRIPVTVNGDAVQVGLRLIALPEAPVTVTSRVEGALKVDRPQLYFTPTNWNIAQTVLVSSTAPSNNIPDTIGAINWSGGYSSVTIPFSVKPARVKCSPDVVELTYQPDGSYAAGLQVWMSAEVATGAPVTVTFEVEKQYAGLLTFDPAVLTFTSSGMGDVVTPQSTRVKRKATDPGPANIPVTAKATAQNKRAGDETTYSLRVKKPDIIELVLLTMVNASEGNCFIIDGTVIAPNNPRKGLMVIDGGPPSAYTNMTAFLPPAGQKINLVLCTHYDNDHIGGLIPLLQNRINDIDKVIFNPPPMFEDPRDLRDEYGNPLSEEMLFSVTQGRELARLAGNKLVAAHDHFTPPMGQTMHNTDLPGLIPRFIGPTDANYAANQLRPTSAAAINRASIMFFHETAERFGFRMLNTGDGYNKAFRKLDITGSGHWRDPDNLLANLMTFIQVPHHGSRENSGIFLYLAFLTRNYLISCSYIRYRHPHQQVIQAIVDANRFYGATEYTIWITAPNLPADYVFPPLRADNEYYVYLLKPDVQGVTFEVTNGVLFTPDYSQWNPVPIGREINQWALAVRYADNVVPSDHAIPKAIK
jgi:hypothetical protein